MVGIGIWAKYVGVYRITQITPLNNHYHSGSCFYYHTLRGLPELCVRRQCASGEHHPLHCFHLCREDVRDVVSVQRFY